MLQTEERICLEIQRLEHYEKLWGKDEFIDASLATLQTQLDRYYFDKNDKGFQAWMWSKGLVNLSPADYWMQIFSGEERSVSRNIPVRMIGGRPSEDQQNWMAQKREPWYSKTEHSIVMRRKRHNA